ncbi:hypothetical protein ACVIRO_007638 [Rhizobium ruizarguesonis]
MKFGVTTFIGVITIVAGLIQFGSTTALSVRQPFVEQQTKLCLSASENAARLATALDRDTWAKSREDFWMLYWGPLAMVEDVETHAPTRVEGAMVEFGDTLQHYDGSVLPVPDLQQPALKISHACRDSIRSKWNVGLLLAWLANLSGRTEAASDDADR